MENYMSIIQNLVAILEQDTGGALVTALTTFKNNLNSTPTPENAVVQGKLFVDNLMAALPSVDGKLIADTNNLLVGDAISGLQSVIPPATPVQGS
jgi:hypothetical protein